MGHAADFALGIALARPERKVICLNGDGSMLMTLGTLVTIAGTAAENLVLIVVHNGTYEITGNQHIPARGGIDFVGMAKAAGFPTAVSYHDVKGFEAALPAFLTQVGPTFITLEVDAEDEGPISRTAKEEAPYLQVSLEASARIVRDALAQ